MKTIPSICHIIILLLFLIFPLIVSAQNQVTVGVKPGDWIKYKVIRIGPESTAWTPPPMKRAEWIKVEVQNVSETTITILEIIHLIDGSDNIRTISWDLQNANVSWLNYIIPANLSPGDKVGRFTIWVNETSDFKDVDLTLNATVSKIYGGVTKEVNMLKFSELVSYFEYWNNNTLEYYWERETGFLLERIWQTRYVELGDTLISTLKLEIMDTNLWKMSTQSFSSQLRPWAIVGLVSTTTGGIILMKLSRANKKGTEVHEK